MNPWLLFVLCFFITAFLAIVAAALRSAGYDVGREWGEDQ